ncbi:hypothetical protein [Arthrobacter monumenti]
MGRTSGAAGSRPEESRARLPRTSAAVIMTVLAAVSITLILALSVGTGTNNSTMPMVILTMGIFTLIRAAQLGFSLSRNGTYEPAYKKWKRILFVLLVIIGAVWCTYELITDVSILSLALYLLLVANLLFMLLFEFREHPSRLTPS